MLKQMARSQVSADFSGSRWTSDPESTLGKEDFIKIGRPPSFPQVLLGLAWASGFFLISLGDSKGHKVCKPVL